MKNMGLFGRQGWFLVAGFFFTIVIQSSFFGSGLGMTSQESPQEVSTWLLPHYDLSYEVPKNVLTLGSLGTCSIEWGFIGSGVADDVFEPFPTVEAVLSFGLKSSPVEQKGDASALSMSALLCYLVMVENSWLSEKITASVPGENIRFQLRPLDIFCLKSGLLLLSAHQYPYSFVQQELMRLSARYLISEKNITLSLEYLKKHIPHDLLVGINRYLPGFLEFFSKIADDLSAKGDPRSFMYDKANSRLLVAFSCHTNEHAQKVSELLTASYEAMLQGENFFSQTVELLESQGYEVVITSDRLARMVNPDRKKDYALQEREIIAKYLPNKLDQQVILQEYSMNHLEKKEQQVIIKRAMKKKLPLLIQEKENKPTVICLLPFYSPSGLFRALFYACYTKIREFKAKYRPLLSQEQAASLRFLSTYQGSKSVARLQQSLNQPLGSELSLPEDIRALFNNPNSISSEDKSPEDKSNDSNKKRLLSGWHLLNKELNELTVSSFAQEEDRRYAEQVKHVASTRLTAATDVSFDKDIRLMRHYYLLLDRKRASYHQERMALISEHNLSIEEAPQVSATWDLDMILTQIKKIKEKAKKSDLFLYASQLEQVEKRCVELCNKICLFCSHYQAYKKGNVSLAQEMKELRQKLYKDAFLEESLVILASCQKYFPFVPNNISVISDLIMTNNALHQVLGEIRTSLSEVVPVIFSGFCGGPAELSLSVKESLFGLIAE